MIENSSIDDILSHFEGVEGFDLDIGEEIGRYKNQSREALRSDERRQFGFRERLRRDWGKAFDLLAQMRLLSHDTGGHFNSVCRERETQLQEAVLFDVLTRLHGRACMVASEILVLLANGHASGAQARWRTLHETVVVSSFIAETGVDTAERYRLHELRQSTWAAEEYREYCNKLGQKPIRQDRLDEMRSLFEELKLKYGGPFATNYGWAAQALEQQGKKDESSRPQLIHLEEVVGLDHLRPYYTLANHSIHADSKSIAFELGLMEDTELILSGPSNYGLTDPGACTAFSLSRSLLPLITYCVERIHGQVTDTSHLLTETLNLSIAQKALLSLLSEAQEALDEAQKSIENREHQLRQSEDTFIKNHDFDNYKTE